MRLLNREREREREDVCTMWPGGSISSLFSIDICNNNRGVVVFRVENAGKFTNYVLYVCCS
jgi:hypothetical protein